MSLSKFKLLATTVISGGLLVASNVQAQDNDGVFTFDAEFSGIYDSNVTVDQLDLINRQGDNKWKIKAGFGYENPFAEEGEFKLGYKFSQTLYNDLTNFDLQSHTFTTGLKNKFGKATVAANYSFVSTKLGGNSFLDMHILSPSVSGFVAPNFYVRVGYNYYDKNFKVANDRDATSHIFTFDGYYFFNESKAYFNVGLNVENEDAFSDIYDLKGYTLRAALQLPVDVLKEGSKIKFGYDYRDRDYDIITPSIGAIRVETRSTFKVSLDVPVYDRFSIVSEYKYTDRDSNFLSSNYTENVYSLGVAYSF